MSGETIEIIGGLLLILALLVLFIKGVSKTFKRSAIGAVLCMIILFPFWIIWAIVEVFTGEIDPKLAKQELMELKYICAWMLAGFIALVLSIIADAALARAIVRDLGDINTYFTVTFIVCSLLAMGVFIIIYNIFSTLNVRKVFPYLIGIGGLGKIVSIWVKSRIYSDFNIDLTILYIFELVSFVVILYAVRAYYIRKPDRWY